MSLKDSSEMYWWMIENTLYTIGDGKYVRLGYESMPEISILPEFENIKTIKDVDVDALNKRFHSPTDCYFDKKPNYANYDIFLRDPKDLLLWGIEKISGKVYAMQNYIEYEREIVAHSLPEFLSRLSIEYDLWFRLKLNNPHPMLNNPENEALTNSYAAEFISKNPNIPLSRHDSLREKNCNFREWIDYPWHIAWNLMKNENFNWPSAEMWKNFYESHKSLLYTNREYSGRASVMDGQICMHYLVPGEPTCIPFTQHLNTYLGAADFYFHTHPECGEAGTFPSIEDILGALNDIPIPRPVKGAPQGIWPKAELILTKNGIICFRNVQSYIEEMNNIPSINEMNLEIRKRKKTLEIELISRKALSFNGIAKICIKHGLIVEYIYGNPSSWYLECTTSEPPCDEKRDDLLYLH